MKSYEFEIGIIGGGPAGSTAANYLAGYGFNVCLIEKKSFPRETLCGEFLSTEVIECIKHLNLFDEFISLNPAFIESFRFFNSSGENISAKLGFIAYGLKRSSFDNLLLCSAGKKGAAIFQPAEVKDINKADNGFNLLIKDEIHDYFINVNYLIAAYGKQNSLDNFIDRSFVNKRSKLNGIKFHLNKNHLKNFNEKEIHIYLGDKIYCGVNAVDDNKVTLCFLEDRNESQPPPRKQLIELRNRNNSFRKLFKEEADFEELPIYGTGNIYFGKRELVENGIFMIGDSAGVIAPLAGDGIGMAMESAKLIADLLTEKRSKDLSINEIEFCYKKEWNNLFFKRMKTALLIQNIILKNSMRNIGFTLSKLFPSLFPYLIKTTRNLHYDHSLHSIYFTT